MMKEENLFVRRASLNDTEGIHAAHMRSIQEVCSKDHSEEEIKAWGHRPYNETVRQNSINNDLVWVVEEKGVIKGYGHLKIHSNEVGVLGHVAALYLTIEILGKSFGEKILRLMLSEAKKSNAKKIVLESTITALGFYEKMGFVREGEQIMVEINNQKIRCFPMKIEL